MVLFGKLKKVRIQQRVSGMTKNKTTSDMFTYLSFKLFDVVQFF